MSSLYIKPTSRVTRKLETHFGVISSKYIQVTVGITIVSYSTFIGGRKYTIRIPTKDIYTSSLSEIKCILLKVINESLVKEQQTNTDLPPNYTRGGKIWIDKIINHFNYLEEYCNKLSLIIAPLIRLDNVD